MFRKFASLTLLTAAVYATQAVPAQAGTISRQNPYRSFNVSGYSYGSTQWERTHHGATSSRSSSSRVWLRRR